MRRAGSVVALFPGLLPRSGRVYLRNGWSRFLGKILPCGLRAIFCVESVASREKNSVFLLIFYLFSKKPPTFWPIVLVIYFQSVFFIMDDRPKIES